MCGDDKPNYYVRWLHTARAVAQQQRRALTPAETRGPFEVYRWAIDDQGVAWFGVVNVRKIMFRVHMVRSAHDEGLFRLNTDVWLEYL